MSDTKNFMALSVSEFIECTAAKTATPGGGSVAGAVGALGVALGQMALNFTTGKKKFAEHEAYYAHLGERLTRAAGMFQDLVTDDVAAYKLYQETSRQEDGPEKDEAVQLATAAAINVPREVAKLALAVMQDMEELADKCNPWLITDLLASAALLAATVRLADYNVRINVPNLTDQAAAADVKQSSADDLARAVELLDKVEALGGKHLP
ncbi:MAG: cyclodeaminase/cyclohydrolase family protein [Planctomycetota bacterium]